MRNVILCGKATVEDIERAVLEQNAHLPEEELNDIRSQLGEFKSYYYETESSQSLIANLVKERPGFEYGNYNFRLRRSRLEVDDEPRYSEVEEAPSLIASLISLGESSKSNKSTLNESLTIN